jgi:hypothetical protein
LFTPGTNNFVNNDTALLVMHKEHPHRSQAAARQYVSSGSKAQQKPQATCTCQPALLLTPDTPFHLNQQLFHTCG